MMIKHQIGIAYLNKLVDATIAASSNHPSFNVENITHRWFTKPWRSCDPDGLPDGFPGGFFRIPADQNKIYVDLLGGGGTETVTLTAGDYDAASLSTEIETQLDLIGVFTVAYSFVDGGKFQIERSVNFDLKCSETTDAAWTILGYDEGVDKTGDDHYISDNIVIHSEEEIRIDFGAEIDFDTIIIKGHNLQSTATIEARYYLDEYITMNDSEVIDWRVDQMVLLTSQSYRYVIIHIVDRDNPDMFVSVGNLCIAERFEPHYQFDVEREISGNDGSVLHESSDGQESSLQRSRYKEWAYNFQAIHPDDRSTFEVIFQEVGISKTFYVLESVNADVPADHLYYVRATSWGWPHMISNWTDEKHWWKLALGVKQER